MNVLLEMTDHRWRVLDDARGLVERACLAAAAAAGRGEPDFEVSVLLASDVDVAQLNKQWRGKTGPTNVLSFPAAVPPGLPEGAFPPLGDIILAYGVIEHEANQQGKPLAAHTSHLVIHAMLHLFGYDHGDDGAAAAMEAIEVAAMRQLNLPDPYFERNVPQAPAEC